MTRKLAALLITLIVFRWTSPEALAQDDKTLEAVRSMGLESLPGPVPTYYSPGARPRAEVLQRRVREAVSFFESRHGIPSPMSLAVLNEAHAAAVGGAMRASAAPRVVVWPVSLENGSAAQIAQIFRAAHTAASSPEVRQAWASLGVSHEMALAQVLEAMVFHEVGHVYVNGALGFSLSRHWFNEFMATYIAYTFLRSREPATISLWNAVSLDIVHGIKPSTRKLDELNRLYMGVGLETYGWFQSHFNLRVSAVLEQMQDRDWFSELRAAGLDKGTGSLTTSELLDRLDRITPGLKQWAEKLEAGQ